MYNKILSNIQRHNMLSTIGPLNKMKKKLKYLISAYIVTLPLRYYSKELAALRIDESIYRKLYPKVILKRDIYNSYIL